MRITLEVSAESVPQARAAAKGLAESMGYRSVTNIQVLPQKVPVNDSFDMLLAMRTFTVQLEVTR